MQTVGTCLIVDVIVDYRMQVKSLCCQKHRGVIFYFRFYIILDDVNDLAIVERGTVVQGTIQYI